MSDAANGIWASTRLAEIARVVRGRVAPQDHPWLPFIGMDNVEAHTMRLLDTVPAAAMKSASVHFYPGDVLYGRLRPYLNKVIAPDFEGLASAEFIPLTMPEGVDPRFVLYRINASDFVTYASHLDEGDRPRVDFDQIGAFPLYVPPTREQHRIVSAIESYFTRLDDAVTTLERVQRNLKRYRAAVLKAAVEGRLVPTEAELARAEGRSYEPASVLLTRILAERRQRWEDAELAKMTAKGRAPKDDKWKAKYVEPVAPDTSQLPELPEGWCWGSASQVAADKDGSICAGPFGTIFKAKDFRPTGVPIIQLRHVKPDRFLTQRQAYMGREKWEELFEDGYSVFGGELLITKLGDPPGDCAVFPAGRAPSMLTPDVMKLEVEGRMVVPRFVMHYINSTVARRRTFGSAFGTTRLRLTLPLFRAMPIPIPPVAEQSRIVAAADRLLTVADDVDRGANRDASRCASLRQSILKWAFEGRLVDQDPTDEPASLLLERIRAERASSTDTPPRRARRAKARAPKP